jgi:hypothetical protein
MTTYPIADYVTLYFTEAETADLTTGRSKFIIPASTYMSNAKGQYCLLSVADAGMTAETFDDTIGYILYSPKPLNNGSNNPILASFPLTSYDSANDDHYHSFTNNNIKYLIPARPSSIVIQGIDSNGNNRMMSRGWITLKFEYLSKTSVNEINNESDYTTF